MDRAVLIRYHEIALKGENRRAFEERLAINIRKILTRATGIQVKTQREHGRILVETDWNETSREALSRVFGITNFSPMRRVPSIMTELRSAVIEETQAYIQKYGTPASFRIFTRRTEKILGESSMQIDREMGAIVCEKFPELKVDLENPVLTIGLEIRKDTSFVWTNKMLGPQGLPVGSNGNVLALLSGGIDSPVAAIEALKRGARVSYVHFYGTPFVGQEALEKVEDLVRLINRYQPDPQPLYVVPFGKIQEQVALATDKRVRTIIYRRLMIRIAEALAPKLRAQALITGESIGQVASQTIENMATINSAATIPVLRPLVTHDKDEIIAKAKRLGTFTTSIRPAADCCTLFADRHPAIRAQLERIHEEEARLPMNELIERAISGIEIKRV